MTIRIELTKTGDVNSFKTVSCPDITAQKGEILIRHEGIGVNFIDIYQRTGLYPIALPAVLGVEGAGIIEAVGEDVSGLQIGDRIAYASVTGGYASRRILPAWRAIKLPDTLSLQHAAVSFLRGLTVHMLMSKTFKIEKDSTLLVHGGAGGLASIAIPWAKKLGAKIIATVGSEDKAEIAFKNGADHLIIGRNADIPAAVKKWTDGDGVDFAIDGIGGSKLRQTFDCMRKFGTVASIGQVAGPIPPISVDEIGPYRSLSLSRPSVMAYAAQPSLYKDAAAAVLEAIDDKIVPTFGCTFPLEDVAAAHLALEKGQTTGSILLQP